MPGKDYSTSNLNKLNVILSSNARILFVGIILITLLFVSYLNFTNFKLNKTEDTGNNLSERLTNFFKSKSENQGEIDDLAATDVREELFENNVSGATDSTKNLSANWTATDYSSGEIPKGNYTVKTGDTLWEIAEAVYGNGNEWKKILEANKENIDYLPNGTQALIISGQSLNIP